MPKLVVSTMSAAGRLQRWAAETDEFTSLYYRHRLKLVQAFVRRCLWLELLVCFRLPALDIRPEPSEAT
ncbi:MAG: hypothetical protein ACREC0_03360 [Methylocella sp.]